jgi:hypothetical protein
MIEDFESPYDNISGKEQPMTPSERMDSVKRLAVEQCEKYLKNLFNESGKIVPGQKIDVSDYAYDAMQRGIIKEEEFKTYREAFKNRFMMGYPAEIN